jgi:hypothetical protein
MLARLGCHAIFAQYGGISPLVSTIGWGAAQLHDGVELQSGGRT